MKLVKVVASVLLASTVMLTVTACAPTHTSESTGGYIDDSVITAKVKSKLLAEPKLKSTEISVETFKAKVQLSGFVSSQDNANKAVAIAQQVPGVTQVINNMQVK